MKPKDLLKYLEKGDRTMEHLSAGKHGAMDEEGELARELSDAMRLANQPRAIDQQSAWVEAAHGVLGRGVTGRMTTMSNGFIGSSIGIMSSTPMGNSLGITHWHR